MRLLLQVGSRARLLRAPRASPHFVAPLLVTTNSPATYPVPRFPSSVRFLHEGNAKVDASEPPSAVLAVAADLKKHQSFKPDMNTEKQYVLRRRIKNIDTTYHEALQAFNVLRSRDLKLTKTMYLSLLYKASRAGRPEIVLSLYQGFLEDEKQGFVQRNSRPRAAWPQLSIVRMQMQRLVLWAMVDTQRYQEIRSFYQRELANSFNKLGIYEADAFNFLLRMECTVKLSDEQVYGLRQRVETLLNVMERLSLHTSYSSSHALFRLIFHRSKFFVDHWVDRDDVDEESATDSPEVMAELIIGYMERFPHALALDPKRISVAVSTAAGAGQHEASKVLLQFGSTNHVPIDAGSFAHAVESAPDDERRIKIADLYIDAKEHELVYTTQNADRSIVNHLLFQAVHDGNFKHTMELLHEMQFYRNKASTQTVRQLFKSIAAYRAKLSRARSTADADRDLAESPTIMELFVKFPDVIPRTVHSFTQGIRYSLFAGEMDTALDLMRAALWAKDVLLWPDSYSQMLYPLLAGGRRGGDESSDANMFDRLEVERCFDQQHPKQRTVLNSLVVNICQSNDDFSTMLVCLDRWQAQGHPPMSRRLMNRVFEVISKQLQQAKKKKGAVTPGTDIIVDGMKLSYLAFLIRYHKIVTWDTWTLERAIVRARTSGLYADVVALLAEADSRGFVLNSTASIVSLCVLEEVGEPSAVVAYAEKMKANDVWEKAVSKDSVVQEILDRALARREGQEPHQ
ncbi:hypothetical protein V7S43_017197 [Phytophthora oleae]|uniref:Pentacotripeptide-repeat region of PRORP domain-containing protein n=1 Tax=Phytophthora oleae TaxID=2107226 RepID=A0ABD3ETM4_9STRA